MIGLATRRTAGRTGRGNTCASKSPFLVFGVGGTKASAALGSAPGKPGIASGNGSPLARGCSTGGGPPPRNARNVSMVCAETKRGSGLIVDLAGALLAAALLAAAFLATAPLALAG